MASKGLVRIRTVFEMLDDCAQGYTFKKTDHYYCVMWKGKTYPTLRRGGHGKGAKAEIEIGHVKSMRQHLEIDEDCVRKHIPGIGKNKKRSSKK